MKFRLEQLWKKADRLARVHGGPVTINLPFVSFSVNPEDVEKRVARELLIRLPDKRVLSSKECCDNCIDNSLASIQEIRRVLVDKQVELAHLSEGSMYLLIEYMAEPIRQFLTFSEQITAEIGVIDSAGEFYRPAEHRRRYFEALEHLRFHLHSCLKQVAAVAEMSSPKVDAFLISQDEWHLPAYEALPIDGKD